MKAIVHTRYGQPDVLEFRDLPTPVPTQDELLIRVRAASVNAYDWHMLTADPFLVRLMGGGLWRPSNSRFGADFSGQVEDVGSNVRQFRPGDEVFGDLSACGNGSFAEYALAPEAALAAKPANLNFEQAAAVPMAALTALQALRDAGHVQPGQRVLVNGASGGVGTFAVQIARYYGAEVTAVCSTRNLEQARALGAERVIDYTREDFTRGGQRYDLILGVNGYHPLAAYRRALQPHGTYLMAGGSTRQIFEGALLGSLMSGRGRRMGIVSSKMKQADLVFLRELIEAGKVNPVIDRRYTLDEVPEAMRYLGQGHARGKVVILVAPDGK